MQSHPMRVCGLKRSMFRKKAPIVSSHPMLVCGLKRSDFSYFLHRSEVTQYMCVNFIFDVILVLENITFIKAIMKIIVQFLLSDNIFPMFFLNFAPQG